MKYWIDSLIDEMSVGSPVHQLFLQSMMSEGVLTMEETKELYKRAARTCKGEQCCGHCACLSLSLSLSHSLSLSPSLSHSHSLSLCVFVLAYNLTRVLCLPLHRASR